MGWNTISLSPGLNTQITPVQGRANYTQTQFIRFKTGLAQKLGGWARFYPTKVDGIPKAAHAWVDLANLQHFAMGTTADLDVITVGSYQDVAPQTFTTNVAVNFATTIGSPLVTIVDSAVSNITTYDSVYFNTPISVGGLILSGVYPVTATITATSYQITATANATATVTAPGGALPTFTTTSGSANITVVLTGHGRSAGDDIVFPLPTTVGGIVITGRYVIQSIVDPNTFIITGITSASAAAGPTAMNGGNAGYVYYIATGPQAIAGGYGTGTYGTGGYGTGTAITGQTGTNIAATDWSLDHWGELLLACPEGGGLYYWGPSSGYKNMSLVSTAPPFNNGMFVSTSQQLVICFGSTQTASIGVYQDPLLVKWSDVQNFFQFTPLITNQAGSYRLPSGNRIVGGASTQQRNVLWTDTDFYVSSYIGATLVFNMVKAASGSGLIAKHAHGEVDDVVYWMGSQNFYMYDGGGARAMPCPVWDAVFQDLDRANATKCHVGVNKAFTEICFWFPSLSGGLGICDKVVKYNYMERTWDYSSLQRNLWIDSTIYQYPIAATNDGTIYYHELTQDADGVALTPSFTTGYFYIGEGEDKFVIDRIYPDFRWGQYGGTQNAILNFTFSVLEDVNRPATVYGPFAVNINTQEIEFRMRGRQIAVTVQGNDIGSFWRLGAIRFRVAADGRSGG
jgi:hypothetical protein